MPHTRREPLAYLREMRLPKPERQAARAERLAERDRRAERDDQETAARRAARIEAESRRDSNFISHH